MHESSMGIAWLPEHQRPSHQMCAFGCRFRFGVTDSPCLPARTRGPRCPEKRTSSEKNSTLTEGPAIRLASAHETLAGLFYFNKAVLVPNRAQFTVAGKPAASPPRTVLGSLRTAVAAAMSDTCRVFMNAGARFARPSRLLVTPLQCRRYSQNNAGL